MVLDYNEGVDADAVIAGRQKAVPARGSQIVGAAFGRDKDHDDSPPKLGGYEHWKVIQIHHQFPVLYIFRCAGDFFTLF